MGREVRRVPANWQHPTDAHGALIPMHARFPYDDDEIREGIADGWLTGEPPYYGIPVMPGWSDAERTHWQMYETCSEGTPISPAFATPEELAWWLADSGASAFGNMTASYSAWLATLRSGSAISAVVTSDGHLMSGVEAEAIPRRR